MSIEKVKAYKVDGELRAMPPKTEIIDAYWVDGKFYEDGYEAAQDAIESYIKRRLSGSEVERCQWNFLVAQMLFIIESDEGREILKVLIEELEK